jgi:hypothetical protein
VGLSRIVSQWRNDVDPLEHFDQPRCIGQNELRQVAGITVVALAQLLRRRTNRGDLPQQKFFISQ